jgi:hypothetical protein
MPRNFCGEAVFIVRRECVSATTNHVGTAALGCPAELRDFRSHKKSRASLDWTAEAAVPTRFVMDLKWMSAAELIACQL